MSAPSAAGGGAAAIGTLAVADAASVARLHAALFDPAWSAREIADLIAAPGVVALAARDGAGGIAGFVITQAAADEAEILSIGVAAGAQRRGLGAGLLAAVAARLAAAGISRLFLEVAVSNAAARALYARAGFAEVGRRRGYYARPGAPAGDALVLARELAPRPDEAIACTQS